VGYVLLVDDRDRPLGWIGRTQLAGDGTVDADSVASPAELLEPESTLRDALSALLLSSVQLGVVVDSDRRVLGLISVDDISEILRQGPDPSR